MAVALRDLRVDIERDLGDTVEGEFQSPVILTAPDGTVQSGKGSVRYDYVQVSPSGDQVVVKMPMVVLRISSWTRVPSGNEQWGIQIPASAGNQNMKQFVIDGKTKAPERADSIGYILLFPLAVVQS